MDAALLFDERAVPGFSARLATEAARCTAVDLAVGRMDPAGEILAALARPPLQTVRLLVTELRTLELERQVRTALTPEGQGAGVRPSGLVSLLDRNVLALRVAPLGGWTPDFAVFREAEVAHAVYLGDLGAAGVWGGATRCGPAFTVRLQGEPASLAAQRFQEGWERAHDVTPAVRRRVGELRRWWGRAPGRRVPKSNPVDTLLALG